MIFQTKFSEKRILNFWIKFAQKGYFWSKAKKQKENHHQILLHIQIRLCTEFQLNLHMHKMGLRRPKHYIFADQIYSKNARRLRFHVLLHFDARKHMISSFYLKWTEFIRNCKFVPIYFGSPETKLLQLSVFLVKQYTSLIYVKEKSFCLVN